jgi:nucleotide-binding universal stress UspA family protein
MDYTIQTILYATDLGPHGSEVFNHAFSLAKQYDAKIHIVHALEPMSDYAQSLVETLVPPDTLKALHQQGFEQVNQEMHRRLEKFCQEHLHPEAQSVVADMRVVEGHPAQVILDEAKRINANLIVLGSHGQTALGEMFMGSVAHKVLIKARHPGIPVFLVPIDRV